MIYEILIRGKSDGTISGSHVKDFTADGNIGLPRAITDEDWPKIVQGINAALLATNDAVQSKQSELDAVNAKIESLKNQHSSTLGAIKSAVLDVKTPTDSAVLAIVTDATKDDVQKEREQLDAMIAELEKKRASL